MLDDDNNNENDRISTNQNYNYGGYDGGGDGGQGRGRGGPRTVTAWTCAQRSREMRIIGRDGQEFRPQGEWGVCPHRRGGGRPPNMVGEPHAGAPRKGLKIPYTTTPRGGPLGKFASLGMMGADIG